MLAALRILFDVLAYRLRRLEMANLVAAVAIALALRLPLADVALRSSFALVLNLLAYLTNDYCDVEHDLSIGRAEAKTRFLAQHLREALGAQVGLCVVLGTIALLFRPGLFVAGVAGAALCWLYSAKLKYIAYADVAAMAAWGVAMPLVAVPLDSALGWALILELGLFSTAFELIQVLRDREEDAARGVVTTAVRLGADRTLVAARLAMAAAALYCALVLQRWVGLALCVAPLLPYLPADPSRYWTRVRLVLGLGWLAVLGQVFATGGTNGFLVSVR